jgi:type II secretory pathway pseudopilin PulG
VTGLEMILLAGLVVAVLATAALAVVLRRDRARTGAELARARAESEQLQDRLSGLERRLDDRDSPVRGEAEFVITDIGEQADPSPTDPTPRLEGRLFADLVLRETVVKAAGLAHGVRRAASPENRFRMRYAYSREVRQARKRRRLELRRLRRVASRGREDAA